MAGIKLDQMGPGRMNFRASLACTAFPTMGSRTDWDARNARVLRAAGADSHGSQALRAVDLANRIDPGGLGDLRSPIPMTMASARCRLEKAELFGAHGWELCTTLVEPAHFFTVVPTYGGVDDPAEINPILFKERLRFDLNSKGACGSDGILMAIIEAEYQSRTGRWYFHVHGVASGGKLQAVDSLRNLPSYRSPRRLPGEPKRDVAYRIKIARRPLFNMPDPLTYCVKQWNARWMDDDGERSRRRRLPRAVVAAALLWQDQWTLGAITLLMGLRPGRDGFVVINSTRMK